jgi:hypothetical protein
MDFLGIVIILIMKTNHKLLINQLLKEILYLLLAFRYFLLFRRNGE